MRPCPNCNRSGGLILIGYNVDHAPLLWCETCGTTMYRSCGVQSGVRVPIAVERLTETLRELADFSANDKYPNTERSKAAREAAYKLLEKLE